MVRRFGALLSIAALAGGCCEVTQMVHPAAAALDAVAASGTSNAQRAYIGVGLEENVSGSLEELVISEGLRVARVEKGSPAESSGVRRGDLVTKANGAALQSLDQWQAVLDATNPGEHMALEIERAGGISHVDLVATSAGGAALPDPTRFAERAKARVIVETVAAPGSAPSARVAEFLDASPLQECGVEVGDTIRSLDGAPVVGATDFLRALADKEPGSTIELELVRGEAVRSVEVELLAPPRILTGLGLPILFHFDRNLTADTTEFAIADLWLIALYDYRREGETRRHRILRWIRWQTGEGTLSEESS